MVSAQRNMQSNVQANKPLPEPSLGQTLEVGGQKYYILKYESLKGPNFNQSIEIASSMANLRMLTSDDIGKILKDKESVIAFINELSPDKWGYARDVEVEAKLFAKNFPESAMALIFGFIKGKLKTVDTTRSAQASSLILKDDTPVSAPIQQETLLNFPVSKTDPKRWEALKRDLGIGSDHTEDPFDLSSSGRIKSCLAEATFEEAERIAMMSGLRLIRISDIQSMSEEERKFLRTKWYREGLWLGDAPDIDERRKEAIEAVLRPHLHQGLSEFYAHKGKGQLYIMESYWDNRMTDVIGVGCADNKEEVHRFCAVKDE